MGAEQYQTDAESGLMLLGNRFYDPSIGRFLSSDPAEDGSNWYAYVENNPTGFTDPEGLQGKGKGKGKGQDPPKTEPKDPAPKDPAPKTPGDDIAGRAKRIVDDPKGYKRKHSDPVDNHGTKVPGDIDCGTFAGDVVRPLDDDFPAYGATAQHNYMTGKVGRKRYTTGDPSKGYTPRPGDILTRPMDKKHRHGHIGIVLPNGDIADASLGNYNRGGHGPRGKRKFKAKDWRQWGRRKDIL